MARAVSTSAITKEKKKLAITITARSEFSLPPVEDDVEKQVALPQHSVVPRLSDRNPAV
jgi:hypothetical protein